MDVLEKIKGSKGNAAKFLNPWLLSGEGGEEQNLKREKGYNFHKPRDVIQHYQLQQWSPSLPGFHKSILKLKKTKCSMWLAFIRSLCHTSQYTCAAMIIILPRDNIYKSSTSTLKAKWRGKWKTSHLWWKLWKIERLTTIKQSFANWPSSI